MARKISVLAREGEDISSLISELLSAQNSYEADNTLPNFPEGGWGADISYSTNCLDTSLALNAISYTPVPKGLLVINKTIAAGETQDFYFDYALSSDVTPTPPLLLYLAGVPPILT